MVLSLNRLHVKIKMVVSFILKGNPNEQLSIGNDRECAKDIVKVANALNGLFISSFF